MSTLPIAGPGASPSIIPPVASSVTVGPLVRATRRRVEEVELDGPDEVRRVVWERASGVLREPMSKRLLVGLSHTVERAVMSGPVEQPTVLLALFQRVEYFDREREVYRRMAAAGVQTVVGFVRDDRHRVPDGVDVVLLDPDEPLADEWTVVALGPRAGAFVVATDQHVTDQHAGDSRLIDVEADRLFAGRWGFARSGASTELARLRFALGERLSTELRRVIDGLLAQAVSSGADPVSAAGTPGERWATTALHHLVDRQRIDGGGGPALRGQLADAHAVTAARAAAPVDPASGLPTAEFLRCWVPPGSGPAVPVGLALFDVPALDVSAVDGAASDVPALDGAALDGATGDGAASDGAAGGGAPAACATPAGAVAAALTRSLGPVDTAVRLSPREFLLVVPGASAGQVAQLCDAAATELELDPAAALRAVIAMTVTAARPLPLAALRVAVAGLDPAAARPVSAGLAGYGEPIMVASSRLHAATDLPSDLPSLTRY